jgi:hypothetical protein
MTDKNVTICGHGSGNPSTKNLNTYSTARYAKKASNGVHKGIVAVRRIKGGLTVAQQKEFHDGYKLILGRNVYSQSLRQYVFTPYSKDDKYYSDCSSSGCATYAYIGLSVSLLNTAGIYTSDKFETVPVTIKDGRITNPEILQVGDAILFAGDDASRPLQIGHVEFVYEVNGKNYVDPGTTTKTSATSSAASSSSVTYYKKYTGKSDSIVDALAAVGETDTSKAHRTKIAAANGISGYSGTAAENTKLLVLLKNGKLKKA